MFIQVRKIFGNHLFRNVLVLIFLIAATFLAVLFAKGYRFNPNQKTVVGTGLLVANSFPDGASVFINDKLTTATDDTLNLPPETYQVKIVKDGYFSWEKQLILKEELVTQTNCRLFPSVPDLKALTYAGAQNLTPSPDGEKIAYVVASASASPKNGLWLLNLSAGTMFLNKDTVQIAKTTTGIDLSRAKLLWSPNSKQILIRTETSNYLLDIERLNDLTDLNDITARLTLMLDDWKNELDLKNKENLQKLPKEMQQILIESAKNIYFSPDEEKILYTATASAQIPDNLKSPLPSSNNQPQERQIMPDRIYVYDIEEDRNFFIYQLTQEKSVQVTSEESSIDQKIYNLESQYSALRIQPVQWFPSSRHLIILNGDRIEVLEYDATNRNTVYAGNFKENFVYPWPDGSQLIILTSLNPDPNLSPNLYAIDLK